MAKNKDSFFKRLKAKYVFSIRRESKFLESAKATLSLYELFSLFIALAIFMLFLAYLIFKITPFRYLISGNSEDHKQELLELAIKTDSLELAIASQEGYYTTIQKIINGELVDSSTSRSIDSQEIDNIKISDPSQTELELITQVQDREQFTLAESDLDNRISFITPLDGVLSNSFNAKEEHFGIDIVAPKNSPILAIADGIVIYTAFSVKDGHIIIISHADDYISIYKHNQKVLKEIGDRVKAGEAIAIVGNTGDNTTGHHLHFELWQNGIPNDPENFISLKK